MHDTNILDMRSTPNCRLPTVGSRAHWHPSLLSRLALTSACLLDLAPVQAQDFANGYALFVSADHHSSRRMK